MSEELSILVTTTWTDQSTRGDKLYELSNHLGNVLATVSDKKLGVDDDNNGIAEFYVAQVQSATDYYPFGWEMPGRKFSSGSYAYGFNGQMKSPEIADGNYTAEFWEYDSRSARRWNVDPRSNFSMSPYSVFSGNPIVNIDVKGDTNTYYNEQGKFLWRHNSEGVNQNRVVASVNYYLIHLAATDEKSKAEILNQEGTSVIAYNSELEAVVTWSFENARKTQAHKDNLEYAVSVYSHDLISDEGIVHRGFILGTTVQGSLSKNGQHSVNITASTPRIGKFKLDLVDIGWIREAMAHTHPPGGEEFSIDYAYGSLWDTANDGDIPVSIREKTKLYLVTPKYGDLLLFDPNKFWAGYGEYKDDIKGLKAGTLEVGRGFPSTQFPRKEMTEGYEHYIHAIPRRSEAYDRRYGRH